MDDRRKAFRVGLTVFAALVIAALLILMNSDLSWSPLSSQYQLQVLVDQAPGVAPETPVRRRGILIGRVAEVEDTDAGALITMDINSDKHVKTNEIARVQTSLIGDSTIEFTADSSPEGAVDVEPGGPPLPGMYNPTPLDLIANLQGDLKQTIQSLGDAGEQVAELANRLNVVLGDRDTARIDRLMTSAESAMANFDLVMQDVREVSGDPEFKQQLREGLQQLPSLVRDVREIMGVLQAAIASADQNLKNLEGFTQPFGERGPDLVASLETGIDNLGELLGQGALFAKSMNSKEGSLGLLIRDRQIYDQLSNTVLEATAAIRDVRLLIRDRDINMRIRQILDDVRTFTDKIARDPARVARGFIPANRELPVK